MSDRNDRGQLSRRAFVTRAALLGISSSAAAAALAACGAASPAATTAPVATSAPAAPTAAAGGAATAATGGAATVAPATTPRVIASPSAGTRVGIQVGEWNPTAIKSQAGTLTVDTKADVAKLVPLDYKGNLTFWDNGPNQASAQLARDIYDQFFQAWPQTYPNIPLKQGENALNLDYNDMVDKTRTAATGNAAPDMARLTLLWAPEFAAQGRFKEINLADYGFKREQFWSGALKSCTWNDKLYGIPTNNETMAFIWNKQIFADAGLDPERPPATWADVAAYSKQIKDKTGKAGYGMVARPNAGNTPYRFMPVLWAYGSGALDETDENPQYQEVRINNEGGIAALQLHYDMYVRDKSVPNSALTNTQTENGDLFISGQIAMEISHPSEYAVMMDKAKKLTGKDKELGDAIVANMAYGPMPEGPVRRAVVFGGWNLHIFNDKYTGHTVDQQAVRALAGFMCGPEWSTKLAWTGSNPGNLDGFKTEWMKQRLETIKFLDVTTSMLPYGIPFPVIPESTQIMNNVVPDMLQNALTQKMTVKQAADDAADKIKKLIAARKTRAHWVVG
jgi:multiple sugar transport system substrate-binding protein